MYIHEIDLLNLILYWDTFTVSITCFPKLDENRLRALSLSRKSHREERRKTE